jgi:hypothetical protein
MRTIETLAYTFDELSDEAKQNAIAEFNNSEREYFWMEEAKDSIDKALEHFDCRSGHYSIDYSCASHSYVKWRYIRSFENEILEMNGARLWKLLHNRYGIYFCKYKKKYRDTFDADCPFTGVCSDIDFLAPMIKWLNAPDKGTTFKELIHECIESVLCAMQRDYEYQNSDAYITEELINREYEFTENGNRI